MEALQSAAGLDADIMNQSNDILAIEYLKALERSKSRVAPRIIKRQGSSYHDSDISGTLASASAMRNAVRMNDLKGVDRNIPEECRAYFQDLFKENNPVFTENFFDLILYRLRTMKAWQIAEISSVQEGLEYKIEKAAAEAGSLEALIAGIKSKRYTQTRISRILMCCLLNITQEKVKGANTYQGLYARVLGYRKSALPAFSLLCKKSRIPVITSGTQLPQNIISGTDILASDIYALACRDKKAGRDYTEKLIIV
jgi:predicted nucleotidyltransferase